LRQRRLRIPSDQLDTPSQYQFSDIFCGHPENVDHKALDSDDRERCKSRGDGPCPMSDWEPEQHPLPE
jgi:hypothetical protein